jgi:lipid-binding SYLF domain-containing protein
MPEVPATRALRRVRPGRPARTQVRIRRRRRENAFRFGSEQTCAPLRINLRAGKQPARPITRELFMKIKSQHLAAGIAIAACFTSAATLAATKDEIDASVRAALKQFDGLHAGNRELARKAAGELVFPRITKAGAGIGGEYGEGVLRVNNKTVGYYSLSSASIGLTLGVAKHREVILFQTQEALDKFTNSTGWTVGADTAIALVSAGAGGDYDTQTLQKPVLGFVYGVKGLMGDVSLEGSKVNKIER